MSVRQHLARRKLSRLASTALLLLAAAAAVFILWRDGRQLFQNPITLNMGLAGLATVVAFLGLLTVVAAWRGILAACGIRSTPRNDLRIYCYSALGVALPGGIWSIVSRSTLYQALGFEGLRVVIASVVEALVTGLAAILVYALATLVQPGLGLWQRPELALAAAALALCLCHPRVFGALATRLLRWSRRVDSSAAITFRLRDLASWIALEGLGIIVGGAALYILLASFAAAPPALSLRIVAAWAAASAASNLLFWLPGTAVLRDGTLVLALVPALPLALAVLFTILVRVWMIASFLAIAGLVWLSLDRAVPAWLAGPELRKRVFHGDRGPENRV